MNDNKHPWSRFAFAGLSGLATINALLLGQFLFMSRQQLADLGLGFGAAFLAFSLLNSGCYLCIFVLVCAPWIYFTRQKPLGVQRWREIFFGSLLFMAGNPFLCRLFFGPTNVGSMEVEAGFGLAAGLVTFAVACGFKG
jgi:hypothetical protein